MRQFLGDFAGDFSVRMESGLPVFSISRLLRFRFVIGPAHLLLSISVVPDDGTSFFLRCRLGRSNDNAIRRGQGACSFLVLVRRSCPIYVQTN